MCEHLNAVTVNETDTKISWLLQNVLETLGVTVKSYTVSANHFLSILYFFLLLIIFKILMNAYL